MYYRNGHTAFQATEIYRRKKVYEKFLKKFGLTFLLNAGFKTPAVS